MLTKSFWKKLFALSILAGCLIFHSQVEATTFRIVFRLTGIPTAIYKDVNTGALQSKLNPSSEFIQTQGANAVLFQGGTLPAGLSQAISQNCQNNIIQLGGGTLGPGMGWDPLIGRLDGAPATPTPPINLGLKPYQVEEGLRLSLPISNNKGGNDGAVSGSAARYNQPNTGAGIWVDHF